MYKININLNFKKILEKCIQFDSIGTRFDTLEHMVGETLEILYVHPLIFLRFFLSLLKFSLLEYSPSNGTLFFGKNIKSKM